MAKRIKWNKKIAIEHIVTLTRPLEEIRQGNQGNKLGGIKDSIQSVIDRIKGNGNTEK